jgi:hypothetical protein
MAAMAYPILSLYGETLALLSYCGDMTTFEDKETACSSLSCPACFRVSGCVLVREEHGQGLSVDFAAKEALWEPLLCPVCIGVQVCLPNPQ